MDLLRFFRLKKEVKAEAAVEEPIGVIPETLDIRDAEVSETAEDIFRDLLYDDPTKNVAGLVGRAFEAAEAFHEEKERRKWRNRR